jgi:hypothetical protein
MGNRGERSWGNRLSAHRLWCTLNDVTNYMARSRVGARLNPSFGVMVVSV